MVSSVFSWSSRSFFYLPNLPSCQTSFTTNVKQQNYYFSFSIRMAMRSLFLETRYFVSCLEFLDTTYIKLVLKFLFVYMQSRLIMVDAHITKPVVKKKKFIGTKEWRHNQLHFLKKLLKIFVEKNFFSNAVKFGSWMNDIARIISIQYTEYERISWEVR